MTEHEELSKSNQDSVVDEVVEKVNGSDDTSSSSDSDSERKETTVPSSVKAKSYRLFGRERSVREVLGGGKPADIFLWRNKKVSAAVLGGATAVWVLFEVLEYHLLTLICHVMILALAIAFLWSNATTFINKRPPRIPEVHLPQDPFLEVASALRIVMNGTLSVLREIASGRDLKKFLAVVAGLWVLSFLGSCCNLLTLIYIVFVSLHTVPVLYEKYDYKIDPCCEKAIVEINKQYALLDAKVLSKIPRGPLKDKKNA